jgi:hypothetical protein
MEKSKINFLFFINQTLSYLDNMTTTTTTTIDNNSSLLLPSDYFIRKEINEYVNKINFILAFVQTFVVTIGLFGNMLALIVINRKSLRNTSSAVFITYMAIFDSGVLLLHAANLLRPRRNLFLHCSLTYLTDLFTFCANWVLVIITLGNLYIFFSTEMMSFNVF